MAASKKNAKGSKTAHVLNLLTAPGTPKELSLIHISEPTRPY